MKYNKVLGASFIERPNRFIAKVRLDETGKEAVCHVKNTGRCRELLVPGARVKLAVFQAVKSLTGLVGSQISVIKMKGQ